MTQDHFELVITPLPARKNIIRTSANVLAVILSAIITFIAYMAVLSGKSLMPMLLFFPAIILLAYIFKKKYSLTPLVFSDNGISIENDISIKWDEIRSYKIAALDIQSRKTLIIEYKNDWKVLDGSLFARYLYDKGIFFTEAQIEAIEKIFKSKNINKTT